MRFNEVDIEVKHSGLLEVPAGKEVDQLPQSHFQKLIDRKGYEAIIRGLTNLEVWNKNKNPKLSQWASNMADKLKVANKKDESYSNKLFEANAKLIKKLGKGTVSGLKKVGDFAKENIKKSGETARNAIVAGAVAPVGAGIASKISTKDHKKKEPRYTAAEVAALATAMRAKQESLSSRLYHKLSILEKEEPKESGVSKVAKGAAKGAGIGLATGAAMGAAGGHALGKTLTGGLRGKVATGLAGIGAKAVRVGLGTIGGAGGAAFGATRGAAGGAVIGGAKHLYDKHKENEETSKKNEALIEALDRLKTIHEEELGENPKPKKKRMLTPEQKARRQERRRLRRQLQKQGVLPKKPRSGSVTTTTGGQKFSAEAIANAKKAQEASKVAPPAAKNGVIGKVNVDRPKVASKPKPQTPSQPKSQPQVNNSASKQLSDTAKKIDKAIKTDKANKVFNKTKKLRKFIKGGNLKAGLTGAAITAGVGAAGLAAKKLYDKNRKK